MESSAAIPSVAGRWFATTHWSVVLAAGQPDSPQAVEALELLCRTYWYPIYAYVRREGHSAPDTQDLTQGFFAQLLARRSLGGVDPRKGRLRSFLLAAVRHYLADQRDHARALKRGGGAEVLSLDAEDAETRYRLEPAESMDAERIYERRWAITLLDQALSRLRGESATAGRAAQFERLRSFVAGENDVSCAEAAAALGMTEGAVKSAIHRLRLRYRELVREEIAGTVTDASEIDAEIRHLITVVGG